MKSVRKESHSAMSSLSISQVGALNPTKDSTGFVKDAELISKQRKKPARLRRELLAKESAGLCRSYETMTLSGDIDKYTPRYLASKYGVNKKTIYRWRTGERVPRGWKRYCLAKDPDLSWDNVDLMAERYGVTGQTVYSALHEFNILRDTHGLDCKVTNSLSIINKVAESRLIEDGFALATVAAIAKDIGCTKSTVSKHMKALGIEPYYSRRRYPEPTNEVAQLMRGWGR